MRIFTFLILLVAASNSAAASWVKLTESPGITVYIDSSASKKKTGGVVAITTMVDRSAPATLGSAVHLSSVTQSEIKCGEKTIRSIAFRFYEKNMAGGKEVLSGYKQDTPSVPESIVDGSIGEKMWMAACPNANSTTPKAGRKD